MGPSVVTTYRFHGTPFDASHKFSLSTRLFPPHTLTAAGRGGPTTHTPDPPLPANLGARVRRAREGELNVVGEDPSHGVGSPVRRTTDAEPGLQLHHSGGFSPSRVSFTSHCVEFHLPFWRAELTVGVPFWSAYVWSTTRHVWSANVEVSLLETYCWSTFVGVLLLESQ